MIGSLCSSGNNIESNICYFLHCTKFTFQRKTLLNKTVLFWSKYCHTEGYYKVLKWKIVLQHHQLYYINRALLIISYFQTYLFHSVVLQYPLSLSFLFFTLSSSYLVFTIISYFKSRFSCQSCLDSVVCLWVLRSFSFNFSKLSL